MKAKNLLHNVAAPKPLRDDQLSSIVGGAGVSHADFTIMKIADKASVSLFKACCKGAHFDDEVLHVACRGLPVPGGRHREVRAKSPTA